MYLVTYTPQAEDDLFEIVLYYTEQGGLNLGESVSNRIKNHIDTLEQFPYRTAESELIDEARELIIKNLPFKAFVYIEETAKKVHILRILHTSRKFP